MPYYALRINQNQDYIFIGKTQGFYFQFLGYWE
jgi:hypothetical protein